MEARENSIMRSFINYAHLQIVLRKYIEEDEREGHVARVEEKFI
jgi:hypothetical protein